MQPALKTRTPRDARDTPPAEAALPRGPGRLLALAQGLQAPAQQALLATRLRGKNIGLICQHPESPAARLFTRAATELGAHVAHIRTELNEHSSPRAVTDTARVLGRLYDAIECQDLPATLVHQIESAADVPVYDGLATDGHPSAAWVQQLEAFAPGVDTPAHAIDDRRRRLVQAWLVETVG